LAAAGAVPATSSSPTSTAAARTPLQADVAKIIEETRWPQSLAALKKLLASHTDAEKIEALMPFLDTRDPKPPATSTYYNSPPPATYVLGEIGEPAAAAVTAALADPLPSRRRAAALALQQMAFDAQFRYHKPGASAVPQLAELLATDPSEDVRREAATALDGYKHEAALAIPQLMAALDDRSEDVRHVALYALAQAGPDVWPATAKLASLLNQQGLNQYERGQAAVALASIGPGAWEAVPALIDSLEKESQDGFSEVGWAIEAIGGIKPEHAAALIRAFPKAKAAAAATALKTLKPADPQAVAGLILALDHAEYWNGYAFGDAIAALATANFITVDDLRTRMAGERPETQIWAAYAYFRLTGDARAARDVINPIASGKLKDPRQAEQQSSAARALAMMGRAAAPAADMLRRQIPVVTNYEREWFSRALVEAVGEFDVSLPPLVEDLAINNRHDDSYHEEAVAALVAIGPAAADAAAPALERMVNSARPWDHYNHVMGADTLANMGPSDATRATLPSLKRMLGNEEWPDARRAAAEAIWQITHDAATAVPPLVELLKERGSEFPHVTAALKSMGPAAREARAAFEKIRDGDPNPMFRQYAAEALGTIVPAKDQPPRPAGDAEFARWWEDLQSDETHVACPAVWRLAEAGDAAMAFLKERTKGGIEALRQRLQSDVGKDTPAELAKVEGCGGEIRRYYRAQQAMALRAFLAAPAKSPR
jgi:HEAT repeat protein